MSDGAHFGERLRIIMAKRDMSGRELAGAMNISPQMVCEMTKGKKWPSAPNLLKMSKALDVSIDWIMTDAPVELETAP